MWQAGTRKGRTALMANAESGNDKMVKYLLEHGADPTLKEQKGMTALDFARLPPDEKAKDDVKARTHRKPAPRRPRCSRPN